MTIYSLDLLFDRDGKPWLIEWNGIRSGMKGFEQVYGDKCSEQKVHAMLQEEFLWSAILCTVFLLICILHGPIRAG